jgi:predicted transcriptional regulator
MRDGDVGAVPVVEDGKLVGIVTDRDIVVRSVADGKNADSERWRCNDNRAFYREAPTTLFSRPSG